MAPVRMLCIYRLRKGVEKRFVSLLGTHWPVLRGAGLATAKRAQVFRGEAGAGGVRYVEIFEWKDARASARGHRTPEVLEVWGAMTPLLASMEFIEVRPARLGPAPKRTASRSAPAPRKRSRRA